MSSAKPHGVGARLRQDLERADISARGLARALAGPDATRDDVERWRRYVVRWLSLNDGHGMTPANAELVADALNTDPDRYLSPVFSRRQQLQTRIRRLQDDLRAARDELARLPKP